MVDESYEVTPLHQGCADAINKIPNTSFNKWEVNAMQDIKAKHFLHSA